MTDYVSGWATFYLPDDERESIKFTSRSEFQSVLQSRFRSVYLDVHRSTSGPSGSMLQGTIYRCRDDSLRFTSYVGQQCGGRLRFDPVGYFWMTTPSLEQLN